MATIERKRVTLHPVRDDGTPDPKVCLYPKTFADGIVDRNGELVNIATQEELDAAKVEVGEQVLAEEARAKDAEATKQNIITDLEEIRTGASAGATAVQPAAISDMATKTWATNELTKKQNKIDAENLLNADLVDDRTSEHKFISNNEKQKLEKTLEKYIVTANDFTIDEETSYTYVTQDFYNILASKKYFIELNFALVGGNGIAELYPAEDSVALRYSTILGNFILVIFDVDKENKLVHFDTRYVQITTPNLPLSGDEDLLSSIQIMDDTGSALYKVFSGYTAGNNITIENNTISATSTIEAGVADVLVNEESVVNENNIAVIEVPTAISDLDNDSGFTVVSGTNDGTNWTSLTVDNDTYNIPTPTGASWGSITGTLSNQTDLNTALGRKQDTINDLETIRSGASAGATAIQSTDLTNALSEYTKTTNLATVATSGSYTDLVDKPTIPTDTNQKIKAKNNGTDVTFGNDDTVEIIAGTNVTISADASAKTITINSIASGGTTDYTELDNKPQIAGTTLSGNKTLSELGIQSEITATNKIGADYINDSSSDNKFVTTTEKSTWSGKQDAISSSNKISADYVNDSSSDNKFVTASEKSTWNAKQDAISASSKLNADYIADGSTNKVVTASEKSTWNAKQDAIGSSNKLSADYVSDGSTNKVVTATEKTAWNAKQDPINAANKLSADYINDESTTNKFVTSADKNNWDAKQTALVSGTNIKTINNQSILGSGNVEIPTALTTEVTYSQLKALRDSSQLIPGKSYRITDYTCTTTQQGTSSANHQFDIIVTAISTNSLSEIAKACLHAGDTYFANSNLDAWKLWYSLDNDSGIYAWESSKYFTGASWIYYRAKGFDMPTQNHPYAWRSNNSALHYYYTNTETPTTEDKYWTSYDSPGAGITIASVGNEAGKGIIYRMIDEFDNDCEYDFKNILFTDSEKYTNVYTFSNTIDNIVYDNSILANKVSKNIIKLSSASVGSSGKTCYTLPFNVFLNAYMVFANNFDINSRYNTITGSSCTGNYFKHASHNTLAIEGSSNTFEHCSYITLANYCTNNVFEAGCTYIELPTHTRYCKFGLNVKYITFHDQEATPQAISNIQYLIIEPNCAYLDITTPVAPSNQYPLKYVHIYDGVKGTSSTYKTISVNRGLDYETAIRAEDPTDILELFASIHFDEAELSGLKAIFDDAATTYKSILGTGFSKSVTIMAEGEPVSTNETFWFKLSNGAFISESEYECPCYKASDLLAFHNTLTYF